jgi:alpha-L-fucosidase
MFDGDADTFWATDDAIHTPELVIEFAQKRRFNVVRLREAIQLGQRIGAFAIDAWQKESWREVAHGTSVGSCRLIRLPDTVEADRIRLRITDSPVCVALAEFGVFLQEERESG